MAIPGRFGFRAAESRANLTVLTVRLSRFCPFKTLHALRKFLESFEEHDKRVRADAYYWRILALRARVDLLELAT